MRLKAASIVFVLMFVAAASGCGGKKSAAGTTSSPTTTAASSTTGNAGGGTTTSSSTVNTHSFASVKNCAQLESVGVKFSQALAAAAASGQSTLSTTSSEFKAMENAAPAAIRSDVETIATAFAGYSTALKKVGYKAGTVPTASQIAALTALSKNFATAKVTAAEQHLAAWGQKNCGG